TKTMNRQLLTLRHTTLYLLVLIGLIVVACGDDTGDDGPGEVVVPDTYSFETQEGASTVAYSGPLTRRVRIAALADYIGDLGTQIDTGAFIPAEGDVVASLDYYFRFDSAANGDEPIRFSADAPLMQTTYNGISADKNLVDK